MIQAAKRAPSSKQDKIGDEQFLCGDSGSFVRLPSKRAHGGDRENMGERWVGISNVLVDPRRLGWNSASDSEGGGFCRWGGSGEIGGPLNLGCDHA